MRLTTMVEALDEAIQLHARAHPGSTPFAVSIRPDKEVIAASGFYFSQFRVELECEHFSGPVTYVIDRYWIAQE